MGWEVAIMVDQAEHGIETTGVAYTVRKERLETIQVCR